MKIVTIVCAAQFPRVEKYRANVAALVVNSEGSLLICERWNLPGAWQFPQGGVDDGESLERALAREVREEIGLSEKDYEVTVQRSGYRYLYPQDVWSKKLRKHGNHGQEQTYFLCRLKDIATPINVAQKQPEFRAYRWILPQEFELDWLPRFKREVYREVMRDFFGVVLA